MVLSPHLDDAVLSLGASVAALTRRGVDVDVVTVLAGDPTSSVPAGRYDRSCGFTTAGEAAGIRQAEDAAACSTIGANPVWLPFWVGDYSGQSESASEPAIVSAIESALRGADLVLIPGFPLLHFDHAWLSVLVLTQVAQMSSIGCYVEQPYAMSRYFGSRMRVATPMQGVLDGLKTRRSKKLSLTIPAQLAPLIGGAPTWSHLHVSLADRLAKHHAISTYRTQIPKLGALLRTRLSVFEAIWGGEAIAPISCLADSALLHLPALSDS